MRIFGNFTVQKGYDEQGNPVYETVPARYGDMSRQVGHILKENSENTLNTVPFISCYVNNMQMKPDLRRYPQFEETLQVIEKEFNQDDHKYVNEPGIAYDVTRYQPVPYELTMNVDIWTSNTDQKLQLLEQICVLFNPSINLHTNQNVLDWTSLAYCEMTDVTWSSRSLPSGTDTVIDVATLQFQMPILINPPAKVNKMNIIQTILTEIHTLDLADFETWTVDTITDPGVSDFVITTLEDYFLDYRNGEATILPSGTSSKSAQDAEDNGDPLPGSGTLTWQENVFEWYGELRPGISQLRLRQGDDVTDPTNDVVGTLDYHPTDPQKLIVNIDTDTLPTNTQGTVDQIVNPQNRGPGDGTLPPAALGQRYLVLDEVPNGGSFWGTQGDGSEPIASPNDIIQYSGTQWVVVFDANATPGKEYVTNLSTGDQFEWTGLHWQNSYEGVYREGWFRLYI